MLGTLALGVHLSPSPLEVPPRIIAGRRIETPKIGRPPPKARQVALATPLSMKRSMTMLSVDLLTAVLESNMHVSLHRSAESHCSLL